MKNGNHPLIKLESVKKVFYTDEVETHALDNINLEIHKGEYVAIAGPSGCGKSTLLLTAGQLARQMLGSMAHAYPLQRVEHPLLTLCRSHAPVGKGQFDVLVYRQIPNQVEALKDEADLAVSHARALRWLERRHGLLVQRVQAVGRGVEQPED